MRPEECNPGEKQRLLIEKNSVDGERRGEWLREYGLHSEEDPVMTTGLIQKRFRESRVGSDGFFQSMASELRAFIRSTSGFFLLSIETFPSRTVPPPPNMRDTKCVLFVSIQ